VADLLAEGAKLLTKTRAESLSREVTYVPRAGGSATVVATIGRSVFQLQGTDGTLITEESRDFYVAATAFEATKPVRGDRIKEPVGDGTKVAVYQVLHPGEKDVWSYADAYRTAIRIHTKYEKTEDA
jgi:hypothetical protein